MRLNILNVSARDFSTFSIKVASKEYSTEVIEFKERFEKYKQDSLYSIRDSLKLEVEESVESLNTGNNYSTIFTFRLRDFKEFSDMDIESIKKFFDLFNSTKPEGTIAQQCTKKVRRIFGV